MARGGKRAGAGRPKQSRSRSTIAIGEAAGAELTITQLAQSHTPEMIEILAALARDEKMTGGARATAATEVLNRGHGKPPQSIEHRGEALTAIADRLAAALARTGEGDGKIRPHHDPPGQRDKAKAPRKGKRARS